jgi:hypothetical protein
MIQKVEKSKLSFLNLVGETAVEEYMGIVGNWKHKPRFKYFISGNRVFVTPAVVGSRKDAQQIFRWVYEGTGSRGGKSDYDIVPKKPGGVLSFNLGYVPKTTPSSSGGPGKATGPTVFAKKVRAKGITPRRPLFKKRVLAGVLKKVSGKFGKMISTAFTRR